jgi:hypothetical protein
MLLLFLTLIFSLGSLQGFSQFRQWADAVGGSPTHTPEWDGNTLNDHESDYFQGQVIPFVFKTTGLTPGGIYTFNIEYDYFHGSQNAGGYAYIAPYNTSRSPSAFTVGTTPVADGDFPNFYTVNANITNVTSPADITSGTIIRSVTVTFQYTGAATGDADIYWGLYLSRKGTVVDAGTPLTLGAGQWPGGSLQTKVTCSSAPAGVSCVPNGLGGLSINPTSGIVEGVISGIKYSDDNQSGDKQNSEDPLSGWTIYLHDNTANTTVSQVTDVNGAYSFGDLLPGTYTVTEESRSGWTQIEPGGPAYSYSITITAADFNHPGTDFGNFTCGTLTGSLTAAETSGTTNDNIICAGSNVSFTATTGYDNYQFKVGTGEVQNSSSNVYSSTSLTNGASVTVIVTNAYGCTTTFGPQVITVNPNPTVNVGGALTAICQGGTTAALGGSFGGGATSAVWSDGGAGGSFTNNTGSTPGTATYTAAANAPATVTLTLTTSGGSCGTTSDSKTLTVNALPVIPNITINALYAEALNTTVTVTDDGAGSSLSIVSPTPKWKKSTDLTYTAGLPNGVTLTSVLPAAAHSKDWTVGGAANIAPGTYYIQITVYDGMCSSTKDITLNVSAQKACGVYNGDYFVNTSDPNGGSAPIHLSVTITKDPLNSPGDITTSTLTFTIAEVGGPTTNAIGVLSSSTATTATFTKDTTITLSSTKLSKTFDISWSIGGNYANGTNCPETSTEVTVSAPANDFVTGGGYIIPVASGGTKGGVYTNGYKNNFGFNVKWNKNYTNLQGSFNTIIRRSDPTDGNKIHTYQVKSNKPTALIIYQKTTTTPARALITYSNATIKDVTYIVNGICTSTPANCFNDGGGVVTFEVVDFGLPSGINNKEDSVAIHVKDKNNVLWYSSDVYNAGANRTKLDSIVHGNIDIHTGGKAGGVTTRDIQTAPTTLNQVLELKATPNPTHSYFTLQLSNLNSSAVSLRVTDILGRVVEAKQNLAPGQTLRIGNSYKPGVYIVEVIQGNTVKQIKLVKE